MQAQVIKKYKDAETKKTYKVGDVVELSQERFAVLSLHPTYGALVKAVGNIETPEDAKPIETAAPKRKG
ncbi:MAG: hypothetical protein LBU07_05085 [Coriobacteriales bacterium]|jgi:hypothetical protein|nr:hypothetical protein [Coriobacteriales bacterium]